FLVSTLPRSLVVSAAAAVNLVAATAVVGEPIPFREE
ncbi:unnamed protein product, partial [Urochloa humidicola]